MRNSRKKGLILLLFLLASLVGLVYIGTELFQVKRIVVTGNKKTGYDEIVRMSGLYIGQNIFKIDRTIIEERIELNPYLDVLSVYFKYPDEVVVNVKERTPTAVIPYLGSYVVINDEGYVLEIHGDLDNISYPLIQGLTIKGCSKGKVVSVVDPYQIKALRHVLEETYRQELQDIISEILMDDPDDIYIISRNGTTIRLGQAVELKDKLKWLRTPNFQQIDNSSIKGTLDISVASQAIFKPLDD